MYSVIIVQIRYKAYKIVFDIVPMFYPPPVCVRLRLARHVTSERDSQAETWLGFAALSPSLFRCCRLYIGHYSLRVVSVSSGFFVLCCCPLVALLVASLVAPLVASFVVRCYG